MTQSASSAQLQAASLQAKVVSTTADGPCTPSGWDRDAGSGRCAIIADVEEIAIAGLDVFHQGRMIAVRLWIERDSSPVPKQAKRRPAVPAAPRRESQHVSVPCKIAPISGGCKGLKRALRFP